MQRRRFVQVAGGISLAGLAGCLGDDDDDSGSNGNGDFPTDDLRFVVPYSAGGGSDTYARQIAGVLEDVTGETVTVENHEGSGGMIGTREIADSGRGGHDILTHNLPTIAVEYLQQDIDIFDIDDFRDVGLAIYATTPRMAIKNPDLDLETYGDLVEQGPDLDYGHPGGTELAILQIANELHGLEVGNSVTYDGGAQAAQAVASGELDVASAPEGNFQGPVESGDVDAFFAWPSTGSNLWSDLQTVEDDGYESFDWLTNTQRALWTNPGASEAALEWWEDALEETMTHSDMTDWSEETGQHVTFEGRDTANQGFEDALEGIAEEIDLDNL